MDSNLIPDPPEPPIWLSAEAAYGWQCGWTAGYKAGSHYGCTCGFGGFHDDINPNCELNMSDKDDESE